MIGTSLNHYEITAQLGLGGMGEVYRARDSRLGRDVAIKVLPVAFDQEPERVARFTREARLLAALNHPHIASVHGFEQHENKHFLVMELVEGETLQERLTRGPLPMRDALELCHQIAEALEAAHEKSIIHRDLKPGNVKITANDKVKVLDFGLAKALSSADPDAETVRILSTTVGAVMGTPAYMSPEQAKGQALDAQTDVWSFGCILYECITGKRAFVGNTATDCLNAVLHKEPQWDQLPPDTPVAVEQLLRKCLERNPHRRLRDIGDAVADLENASGELRARRAMRRGAITGRAPLTIGAGALVLVAIGWWAWHQRSVSPASGTATRPITSLAVKPLDDFSGDTNQAYLSDGMTEALCAALGNISALRVPGRSSVMRYKGGQKSIQEMARELNVDAVVEGSIQRTTNRLLITVQLIEAATDRHLWSTNYERDMSEFFKVQSEVARAVANEIQVRLTPEDQARLARVRSGSPYAVEACLMGMHHYWKFTEEGMTNALRWFNRATELDPDYAPAYAGAALTYDLACQFWLWAPREVMPKCKQAALTAVQLDPTLAEGYLAAGLVKCDYDWDWVAAERDFRRAAELSPNSPLVLDTFAMSFLFARGRFDEANAMLVKALALEPLSSAIQTDLAWSLLHAGQVERSLAAVQRALELDQSSSYAHWVLGWNYRESGKASEALTESQAALRLWPELPEWLATLGSNLGLVGRREEALKVLADLDRLARNRYVACSARAYVYCGLGENELALDWLEKGFQERDIFMPYFAMNPGMKPLRNEPRFQALTKKVENGGREK